MKEKDAVTVLEALGEPTRLDTMKLLVGAGSEGLPAGVIADQLGRLPSSLTFHLQHLNRAGLISPRRDGRRIIYRAEPAGIVDLVDYLSANCGGGSASELRNSFWG